jgi:hypothetical protein
MRRSMPLAVLFLLTCCGVAKAVQMPWEVNTPIVAVQKSLYRAYPRPGVGAGVNREYIGPSLELLETYTETYTQNGSLQIDQTSRLSLDNGKTWSAPRQLPSVSTYYNGVRAVECDGPRFYDAQTGVLVETWLRQLPTAATGYWEGANTSYSTISRDFGSTWTTPKMLRFEAGPEFDPNEPLAQGYITHNQAYFGNNIVKLANGKLLTAVAESNPVPRGSRCFVGQWDPQEQDYQWTPGNPVAVASDVSGTLTEPEVAELKDGRVLVAWRGGNTATTPGRKWYSVSSDGGMNLSQPAELKYDDGSSFYSPSSYHRMIRSSKTGKLYWIGNITADAPSGNTPRYPLVIAEVDESGATPALRKNTVTRIDGKSDEQPDDIQFTNFSLYEDRETLNFNMYMSLWAERPRYVETNSYQYVITVVPEPPGFVLAGMAALSLAVASVLWRRAKWYNPVSGRSY